MLGVQLPAALLHARQGEKSPFPSPLEVALTHHSRARWFIIKA